MYRDILLTVDFDRTLTGTDSAIPQRNLEAIHHFMENGGKFTVNTGRSAATFRKYLDTVPVNAPFLLYNGSAAWEQGNLTDCALIRMDVWQTMEAVHKLFPEMNLEIQGEDRHYLIEPRPEIIALYEKLGWRYSIARWGQDVGPFIKFSLFGTPEAPTVAALYQLTGGQSASFNEAEETLRRLYGDRVEVFRAAPQIIDIHAKGVSKIAAARRLQEKLGRKLLICVGDGENDISMLEGADYGFCPADAIIADRFPQVCPCGEGAVADVIYKKIPEILAIKP